MVKHRTTRRRGGAWYNPMTWFSATPEEPVPIGAAPVVAPPAVPATPYGGRKRKTRRGGRKSRRSKSAKIYGF